MVILLGHCRYLTDTQGHKIATTSINLLSTF
jgi:hypothetical protein